MATGRSTPVRVEGATESAAATQALVDKLVGRGLDPAVLRLFILDGAKALKAVKARFGKLTPMQRCQDHKARNILERRPKKYVGSVRKTLRKAWEMDEVLEAERLFRDHAKRIQREAPGVSGSIPKGLDEILTVTRLRLPFELRSSLACTNAIENMQGTIWRVTQREALARCLDGLAVGRRWHDRGEGRLATDDVASAIAGTPARPGRAPRPRCPEERVAGTVAEALHPCQRSLFSWKLPNADFLLPADCFRTWQGWDRRRRFPAADKGTGHVALCAGGRVRSRAP